MDVRIKERLVGAAVLASLGIIFVPMLVGPDARIERRPATVPAPPREFGASTAPLEAPRMTKLDEARARRDARLASPSVASAPGWHEDRVPMAETIEPAGTVAVVGGGAWVVQLASFSEVHNAAALRDRLRASGYTAFTESVYGERGSVTRVYVGPELEREEARLSAEALERDTSLKGIVVRYPPG